MKNYFTRPVLKRKQPAPYVARKAVNLTTTAWKALRELSAESGYSMQMVVEHLVVAAKVK